MGEKTNMKNYIVQIPKNRGKLCTWFSIPGFAENGGVTGSNP